MFWDAVREAECEKSKDGCTGTIAEKPGFVLRSDNKFTFVDAEAFAANDVEENDKWGHAFALTITIRFNESAEVRGFLFYGYSPD